jgi:hypothetical protein
VCRKAGFLVAVSFSSNSFLSKTGE